MRTLAETTWVELKLFAREPLTVIFTLALPVIVLYILGGVFGDTPDPEGQVYRRGRRGDRSGAASSRLQPWVRAPPRESPELSHPTETLIAMRYRSANKPVYWARYRLIWCPKYRRVLVAGVNVRLKAVIADVAPRSAPRSSRSR